MHQPTQWLRIVSVHHDGEKFTLILSSEAANYATRSYDVEIRLGVGLQGVEITDKTNAVLCKRINANDQSPTTPLQNKVNEWQKMTAKTLGVRFLLPSEKLV
ncbi:hypothetical protein AB5N19_01332 [Seiridium cardinale]